MSVLISSHNISKEVGSKLLFENLSLSVSEREKVGLIGPNGTGKSSLLKILAQEDKPDEGEIKLKKSLSISFVRQSTNYDESSTALGWVKKNLLSKGVESAQAEVSAALTLSQVGFKDENVKISNLSGGWKKRLDIASALASEPELLILDEPTNHMDWEGIFWLESFLQAYKKTFILVSHDRNFLNQVTNKTIEISPLYREGYLAFDGPYEKFIEHKQVYIDSQLKLEESLGNKARRENEWLKAGVKARTTKSRSRMEEAHQLLERVQEVKKRNRSQVEKSKFEIDSSQRKTKKLIELKSLSVGYKNNELIKGIDLVLGPKFVLGLLGYNGSGKTSLLKAIINDQNILAGEVFRAKDLKTLYFDQKREDLPQEENLMQFLGEGSDYVIFKDQSVHVASYASRFMFSSEKMRLKISQLSGGEQARLLIAKLLLRPADVLILDEPTNDLDIETIEILEETLSVFQGLVLLVSHDRKFLSQVCDQYLGILGNRQWATYASVSQWHRDLRKNEYEVGQKGSELVSSSSEDSVIANTNTKVKKQKVKMSYMEKKQLETIESDIEKVESDLQEAVQALQNPDLVNDQTKFMEMTQEVSELQAKVDGLYATWEVLEEKAKSQ